MKLSKIVLISMIGLFIMACTMCSTPLGQVDPSEDEINMVQPCTLPWCSADTNQQYAEHVNVPNSEANQNNGQANLLNAQATKTAVEAESEYYKSEAHKLKDNLIGGFFAVVLWIAGALIVGTVLVMGIGALAGAKSGNSDIPGGIPWREDE